MRLLTTCVVVLLLGCLLQPSQGFAESPPVYQGLVFPLEDEEHNFYPASVACGPNGWFYVTDPVGHRILAFSEDGSLEWTVPDPSVPLGIAVDREGRLYVADGALRAIQVLSPTGSPERLLIGTPEEPLNGPDAVALDDSLNVYVVDGARNRILKFDSQGSLILAWGERGDGPGQFQGPSDIEVADDGTIFVLETGNSRVQRFHSDGRPIDMWGSRGTEQDRMDTPRGFTVVGQRVIVADTNNYRVKEFDFSGNLLLGWGGWRGAPGGRFESLVDLAYNPNGCTMVVDVKRVYLYCYEVPVQITDWGSVKKRWLTPSPN